jgi:hypothetical protein
MSRNGSLKSRLLLGVGVIATALLILSAAAAAGRSAPSSSTPPPAAVDTQPFGTFLGSCNSNTDCADGLTCESYKQNGMRCTKSCESDSDCAAPSKGCSKQHRCSMPTATAGHPRR